MHKALDIVEIMADREFPARLQDIAADAGLSPSTALRLINTLRQRGYVNQEASSSRYYLSLKLFTLGARISSNFSIMNIARPYLKKVSIQLSRSVNLAVAQNEKVFILDVVGGAAESHMITTQPGRVVPLYCTALGRALMFGYTDQEIDEYCAQNELISFTPCTIVDRNTLKEQLNTSRLCGYSYDAGEYRNGIVGIGVPIMDSSGKPVASISVAELLSVITDEMIGEIRLALQDAAQLIAAQL